MLRTEASILFKPTYFAKPLSTRTSATPCTWVHYICPDSIPLYTFNLCNIPIEVNETFAEKAASGFWLSHLVQGSCIFTCSLKSMCTFAVLCGY